MGHDLKGAEASELEEARREVDELTKALTGLTCGGSEFFIRKGDRYVADIDACVAWVRRSKQDAHRRTVEAIIEAKRLREALSEIARGETPPEQNGHYLAHRQAVKVARAALASQDQGGSDRG